MFQLSEPVNVWVFFKVGSIQPYVFFWRKRRIKVESVNLVHTSKDGAEGVFYHFSVSSGGNFYRLRFELKKLKWFIEAIEEDE